MEPLLFAFRYFTNLPLPRESRWDENTTASSLTWLPLTGAAVGCCLAALAILMRNIGFPQYPMLSGVLILAMELWTGGTLFLDGFCKTIDVLFARPGTVRRLEIISERYLGTKGAMGCMITLLAKVSLIAEFSAYDDFIYVVLFYPCWSRWAFSFASSNYMVLRDEGMAFFFKINQKPMYIILSSAFMITTLLFMPAYFYLAALASFLVILFLCSLIQNRMGGHTEETYGLVSIAGELSLLLLCGVSKALFHAL